MTLFTSPSYIVSAVIGVVVALLLAPALVTLTDAAQDAYDQHYPVATVKAVRVPAPAGEVRLTMTTTKHRDCELQRVFAYDQAGDGTHVRTKIEKLDAGELETIPAGETVHSTVWKVHPVTGTGIVVFSEHDCGGRVVRTRLIEMQI